MAGQEYQTDDESDTFHDSVSIPDSETTAGERWHDAATTASAGSASHGNSGDDLSPTTNDQAVPSVASQGSSGPVASPSREGTSSAHTNRNALRWRRPARPIYMQRSQPPPRPTTLEIVVPGFVGSTIDTPLTADLVPIPGRDQVNEMFREWPNLNEFLPGRDAEAGEDSGPREQPVEVRGRIEKLDSQRILKEHLECKLEAKEIFDQAVDIMQGVLNDGLQAAEDARLADNHAAHLEKYVGMVNKAIEVEKTYLSSYVTRQEQDARKLASIQDKLHTAMDELDQVQTHSDELEAQLSDQEASHSEDLESLERTLDDANMHNMELTADLERASQQCQDLEGRLKSEQEDMKLFRNQLMDTKRDVEKAEYDKALYEAREASLEKSYQAAKDQNKLLNNQISSNETKHQKVVARLELKIQEQAREIREEQQSHQKTALEREKTREDLAAANEDLKQLKEMYNKALDETNESHDPALTGDSVNMQHLASLEDKLSAAQGEKTDLEADFRKLREEAEALRQQVKEEQQSQVKTQHRNQELEAKLQALQDSHEDSSAEERRKTQIIKDNIEKPDQMRAVGIESAEALETQIEHLQKTVSDREKEVDGLRKQASSDKETLEDKLKTLEKNLDSRNGELLDLKEHHDELYGDYLKEKDVHEEIQSKCRGLEKELTRCRSTCEERASTISKLENDYEQALKDLTQNTTLDTEVAGLKRQLREQTEAIAQVGEDCRQLRVENRKLRDQIQPDVKAKEDRENAETRLQALENQSQELERKILEAAAKDAVDQAKRAEYAAQVSNQEKLLEDERQKIEQERAKVEEERQKLREEDKALRDQKASLEAQGKELKERRDALEEEESFEHWSDGMRQNEYDQLVGEGKAEHERVARELQERREGLEAAAQDMEEARKKLRQDQTALAREVKEFQDRQTEDATEKGRLAAKERELAHREAELNKMEETAAEKHQDAMTELASLKDENHRRLLAVEEREARAEAHEDDLRRRSERIERQLERTRELHELVQHAAQQMRTASEDHSGGALCFCTLLGGLGGFLAPPHRPQGCFSGNSSTNSCCSCKLVVQSKDKKGMSLGNPKTTSQSRSEAAVTLPVAPESAGTQGIERLENTKELGTYIEFVTEENNDIYDATPPGSPSKMDTNMRYSSEDSSTRTPKPPTETPALLKERSEGEEVKKVDGRVEDGQWISGDEEWEPCFAYSLSRIFGAARPGGSREEQDVALRGEGDVTPDDANCVCGGDCRCHGKCGCDNLDGVSEASIQPEGYCHGHGHGHGRIRLRYPLCQLLTAVVWFVSFVAAPFAHPVKTALILVYLAGCGPTYLLRLSVYASRYALHGVSQRLAGPGPARLPEKPRAPQVVAGDVVSSLLALAFVATTMLSVALWRERDIWLTDNGFRRSYLADVGVNHPYRGWAPYEADYRLLYQPGWHELLVSGLTDSIHKKLMAYRYY